MLTGMIGEELSHDSELGMQSVSLCEDSVSMNDNDPSNNVTLAAPPSNEQGVCGHIQFREGLTKSYYAPPLTTLDLSEFNVNSTRKRASRASALRANGVSFRVDF